MKLLQNSRIIGLLLLLLICNINISAQNLKLVNLEIKNLPLPTALKLIEKEGGKNINFSYNELERYNVSASIKNRSEVDAIDIILHNTPFTYKETADYFVIQRAGTNRHTVEIRGKVVDDSNNPLSFSNVLLLTPSDSLYVNGCVTGNDGTFAFVVEEGKQYLLKTSYIGYKTEVQPLKNNIVVHLLSETNMIKEVQVTAHRPAIEIINGGLKTNVAGTSLAKMGSAAEMLTHLPMVTGSNGSISVIGGGEPLIYINRRKIYDKSELDRLNASEISSVEVISNPGVQYAADVLSVIRIRTIQKRGNGLSGNVRMDYSQGHSANMSENVALNYRTGGLDIFIKSNFSHKNSYGNTENSNRIDGSSQWETSKNDTQIAKGKKWSGDLGFNYELNPHHSFGMRYMPDAILGNDTKDASGTTITTQNGMETERLEFQTKIENSSPWNNALNGYYYGEFGSWQIDLNADYVHKSGSSYQKALNNGVEAAISNNSTKNDMYAIELKASVPVGDGKLEFGTEETFTERYDLFTQNGFSSDQDNHIKNCTYSLFADYAVSIGKWSLSGGLRYEHQNTDYFESGKRMEERSHMYNNIIPAFSVVWKSSDLSFDFSYRLNKINPSYRDMGNAIAYRSKYEYLQGEPMLRPTLMNRLQFMANWKWLYAGLYWSHTKDMGVDMIQPYDDVNHPGVLLFKSINLPTSKQYGFEVYASPHIGIWNPSIAIGMFMDLPDAKAIGITEIHKQPRLSINLDNNFNLPNNWFLNINGYFTPAAKTGYIVGKTTGQVNGRIYKSFMKDALSVAVSLNDIFHTGYYYFNLNGIKSYMYNRIYRDFQRVGVQISYKFNSSKSKYRGTGAGQSEKNRL